MLEQFIIDTYLKKGETVEKTPRPITNHIVEYTITKQTVRTYKRVALIKIGTQLQSSQPPSKLLTYHFTLHAKRQLDEPFLTIQDWLTAGWIVQEIRLQSDGRTSKEMHYRMGPSYVKYTHQTMHDKNQQLEDQYQLILDYFHSCTFNQELQPYIQIFETFLYQIPSQLANEATLKANWSIQKRQKFLMFCIGYFQLASKETLFDFKQIGATVFDDIGGSKMFDKDREEFVEELERIFDLDSAILGLVSLGKIVPVYFSGQLCGKMSQYTYGAVHALTDDSILQDHYQSEAHYLFLVENRAVLTRMVKEPSFIEKTMSFVLCLDGQIRTAHKMLLKQLTSTKQVKKIIVWTDYDEAGLIIAQNAVKLVERIPTVIIARDYHEYSTIENYEIWLQTELQNGQHEQEQQLGGEQQWMKWIQK
ncbi:DUF2399 domain-containing protein [Rummeliibacillus pycnus]|uniref:DUF2399 domain-containing protein n=1 Tax=Rummeliibacillus pycnus TaxID=101070 RepID=UPI0037C9B510